MLFERPSWLCFQWQYVGRVCGFVSFVYRGEMKGSETSDVNFVRKKSCCSTRTLHKLSIIDEKMLLLTGKIDLIEKSY